jgi:DNA invertase Pin-like site-specific DNA recombinase
MNRAPSPARVRCAIYTRKSSEEGLDQSFNSLDAQREACEAYVLSQAGEGWTALPALYDDGGFSGGNLERPALRRVLADVAAGRVDTIVVYKIDRLTRSLADFAKIVDVFDAKGVSFVSVTQAFNTTTSMGRLTLNVLLSFAQFEREVTGERIRDKIMASKKKGMWMGGTLPLGYDAPTDLATRALVVNAAEAQTVQLIFSKYLELESVHALQRWLKAQDIRSKVLVSARGRSIGGSLFARGALFHVLKNRTYIGEIPHRDQSYPGVHPAIVDRATFDAVQALLAKQTRRAVDAAGRVTTAPLKGRIFDADGGAMTPVYTHSRGKVHRYYVSSLLMRGERAADRKDRGILRAPGPALEALLDETIGRILDRTDVGLRALSKVTLLHRSITMEIPRPFLLGAPTDLDRATADLKARLAPGEEATIDPETDRIRIALPYRLRRTGGRVKVTDHNGRAPADGAKPDDTLVAALKAAHSFLAERSKGQIGRHDNASFDAAPSSPYERKILRLAFLAPDIQCAILEGRQPVGMIRQRLITGEIPAAWADQRRLFASL